MHKTSSADLVADARHDFPLVIATTPATAQQRKIAFGAIAALAVILAVTIPFANIELARFDAFVPVVQTVMCIADLLTAAFLFAQYTVYPQRAVLALASGFVFSGLFAFVQTLAFPGAYAPAGVIGNGDDSAAWLFQLWHTTFPLAVIVYTLSKDAGTGAIRSHSSTDVTIAVTIACVVTATVGLTLVATTLSGYLPSLFETASRQTPFSTRLSVPLSLVTVAALVLLFIRKRTVLDYWLIVTLLAWLPTLVVGMFSTVLRFTVGWYSARVYALCAGSSLLLVLLAETMALYARLARERTYRLAIFNTVVDGIITINRNGVVEDLNPAAAHLFGYSPKEVIGCNVKILMPEPYRREHDGYLVNYMETGQAKVIGIGREVVGLHKNGSTFPMELAVGEATVAGRRVFTGVVRDITERKRSEEHQGLLIAELDHRVKNILARVAVVAKYTLEGDRPTNELIQAFDRRIQSMADAHTLLSQSHWRGVSLADLVRRQLAPYTTETNIVISGRDITLSAVPTQALAMVLQELVTNAVKYGSLSTPYGRVSVNWDRRDSADGPTRVVIAWQETGGPSTKAPSHSSYGTSLIRNLIPHELGGIVNLVFAPEGLRCDIVIPLNQARIAN
jgi:PAS domain S-box-containing protein